MYSLTMIKLFVLSTLLESTLCASIPAQHEQTVLDIDRPRLANLDSSCHRFKRYIALGDSIAVGLGAGNQLPQSGKCQQYDGSYANLFAHEFGYNFTNLGCSGATITDTLDNQVNSDIFKLAEPDLVTISAGADDGELFSNTVEKCFSLTGTYTPDCAEAVRKANVELQSIPGKMKNLVSQIRGKSPNATVVIVSYFRLFPDPGPGKRIPCTWPPQALDEMNNIARDLNRALDLHVGLPVVVAKPDDSFAGHRVCGPLPWKYWFNLKGPGPMHPDVEGHKAIYQSVKEALGC